MYLIGLLNALEEKKRDFSHSHLVSISGLNLSFRWVCPQFRIFRAKMLAHAFKRVQTCSPNVQLLDNARLCWAEVDHGFENVQKSFHLKKEFFLFH